MTLRALRVTAWRNLAQVTLSPGPRVTVLWGQNGQGKTNLVEAAHFLLTFRSFRARRTDEVIGWGSAGARLRGEIAVGGLERLLEAELAPGSKAMRLDGKPVRRDASGLRGAAVVLFVPEDLLLPKAAPAERRRFLDRAVFGAERGYFREAQTFERVLRSRNALLRQGAAAPALLDTYDEQLAAAGSVMVERRRALVSALAPRFEAIFASIHSDIPVRMRYRSHASIEEATTRAALAVALGAGLRARRDLDLRRGFTGFGPHTDDLELELAGHPARDHGSQGQLRSLVLALKLAELAHLDAALGEPPLLLLDDVASELDGERRGRLFEAIAALPGQTLITVTDPHLLPALPGRIDRRVSQGMLSAD